GGPKGSAQATLNSLPNTSFLIQFFTSVLPDPSGYGQGQTLLGSQIAATDSSGNATIVLAPSAGLPAGGWITATATNEGTGDTSEFSNSIAALPVSVEFATASISVNANTGFAVIEVQRAGNSNATVSVNYATANGTAIAGKDYVASAGTL